MLQDSAGAGLLQQLLMPPAGLLVPDRREDLFDVDARIPHIEDRHLAELRHALAIRSRAGQRGVSGVGFTEAVVTTGKDEARGQALDVPLPRSGERLIEIVDVEDDPPFRRGKIAEVHQMAVAARLHAQPGCRRGREIRRHVERRPAIESERRVQHAAVANRNQLGKSPLVRFLQQTHRIRTAARRFPDRVRAAWTLLPQALAERIELSL
jgi:hypothetical protein